MAETGFFRGTGGVVHEMALPLAEVYADQVARGDLVRVSEDGSAYVELAEKPKPRAPRAAKKTGEG